MNKKDLIREWKTQPTLAGVYQIRRKDTGQTYLGTAHNLPGILNSVRLQLEAGQMGCTDLQKDWNTLGPEAFDLGPLESLTSTLEHPVTAEDLADLRELVKNKLSLDKVRGYNF